MRVVNMREAKTHLSRLVEAAVNGEPFIIARGGKPLVKVIALEATEPGVMRRIGFLDGKISVPEDFDRMGFTEIENQFKGKE
ncbi:MAG: type II toxin-antitoxin system Phd/YefM family antitoxin [Deltaproteobacteria bacterium]|nr:type II toxin-antitoxin system Phd/YefM family antitoxin [Deltaproteobacteria bacterium]